MIGIPKRMACYAYGDVKYLLAKSHTFTHMIPLTDHRRNHYHLVKRVKSYRILLENICGYACGKTCGGGLTMK